MRLTIGIIGLLALPLLNGCGERVVVRAAPLAKAPAYRNVIVLPFDSAVKTAYALPDATRTAVIYYLKEEGVFASVVKSEEAGDKDKANAIEIGATLVEIDPGNMAARILVGFGSGRSHATFDFTGRDALNGEVVWRATIREKASYWSDIALASSAAQRLELPEKIAKAFTRELKKALGV
jgi:hypothetical protein